VPEPRKHERTKDNTKKKTFWFLRARLGVLRVFVVCAGLCTACSREAHQADLRPIANQNVLLITIDTLRADHVGAYGYARARTGTLDSLA
jgi:hypothetical protein